MTFERVRFYLNRYIRNVFSLKGARSFLESFGALWLLVEIPDYFIANNAFSTVLRGYWWVFVIVGLVVILLTCKPVVKVAAKLKDRDVEIEIAIGDIFSIPGSYVIGSNSTFDTRISRELISGRSVQGQFTKRHYGDEVALDSELDNALRGVDCTVLSGKRIGKAGEYPIGTVVRLSPKGCTAYFVAIARLNEHGVAQASFDDIKKSLASLWVYVGQRGLKEPLVVPVLGSGFGRMIETRQEIIRAIIRSFIASCAEKTFCDKLTVVLTESDAMKYQIDLNALGDYLRHLCTYAGFAVNSKERIGTPVP
jgi:hypothetical protein